MKAVLAVLLSISPFGEGFFLAKVGILNHF